MTTPLRLNTRFLDQRYELGGRVIDPIAGTLLWNGDSYALRRKQLEVLALMASAGAAIVPRSTFIDLLWAGNALVGDKGLTDTLSSLRRVLHDSDASHPLIRTIPRQGYQLGAGVRWLDGEPAERFSVGDALSSNPGWRLLRRISQTDVQQSWLAANNAGEQRQFRFCCDEQHLRLLQREVTVLRFLREALSDRSDIDQVIDWQLDEPPYYLELHYPAHGSLVEWTTAQGGLRQIAPGERLRWMADAATALAAVHAVHIVHRNVGAESLSVDEVEGRLQIKLGEFGLSELTDRAALQSHNITAAGLTLDGAEQSGPQNYWAPERLVGQPATAAGDVYALGVLIFQFAVGEWLPLRPNWERQVASARLRQLIASCIAEQANARPSAASVAEQLRNLSELRPADRSTERIDEPAEPARPVLEPDADPGRRSIGPYRILEALGEGGMGAVYLAEQRTPMQRQVALKVIKAGMDSSQVLARFEAERQALALMNHINVAAVFDAAKTDTGQPYFAMEYVPGLHITAHCDELALDFRERIELFMQVCDGVTHAHQKGLIHRDLKPSNILVKRQQGQPNIVKIIDFGVAKSLHGKLGTVTAHTQIGSFVGTPVYSSPEQLLGHRANVDTRADVYSMGVVLYELLSGVTPYAEKELSNKSPLELAKLLSSGDPPTLATRYASLDPAEETKIAGQRRTTVARMLQSLGADLSWIVAKCLERDPEDRYDSASELKQELQRWLDDRPVEAKQAGRWYRLRKHVRRHRAAVSLAAIVSLALIGTTTAAVIGFVRAERALEASRLAAAEAKMAADFQVKQMQSLDPAIMGAGLRDALMAAAREHGTERRWDAATLAQHEQKLSDSLAGINFTDLALDQLDANFLKPQLAAIKTEFAAHPLLQAQLWQTMADTLTKLGRSKVAVEPQELALVQRRRLLGDDNPLTLYSLARRAELKSFLGQSDAAESESRAALEGARRVLGDDHPLTLELNEVRSWILSRLGRFEEAKPFAHVALAGQRRTLGDSHLETVGTMVNVALIERATGNVNEGRALAEEALRAHRQLLGDDHVTTLGTKHELALSYLRTHQHADAEDLLREVLEGRRRVLGDKHPEILGILRDLARVLTAQGKHDEAQDLRNQVYETALAMFGPDHPGTLQSRLDSGAAMIDMGRVADAEKTLRDVLARLSLANDNHAIEPTVRVALARALRSRSKLAEALALLPPACERQYRNLGATGAIRCQNLTASILIDLGRYRDAESHLRGVLDDLRNNSREDDRLAISVSKHLADALAAQDKAEEALGLYRNAASAYQLTLGIEHVDTLAANRSLALFLVRTGELDEALALQRATLDAHRRTVGNASPKTLESIIDLVGSLVQRNEAGQAQNLLENAVPMIRETLGDDARLSLLALDRLAQAYRKLGKSDEALKLAETIASYTNRHEEAPHWVGAFQVHHGQVLVDMGRFADAERLLDQATRNYSKADGAPRREMTELSQAYVALYSRWNASDPSSDRAAQGELWNRRLEALNNGAASLAVLAMM